jgi:hypothetical protein
VPMLRATQAFLFLNLVVYVAAFIGKRTWARTGKTLPFATIRKKLVRYLRVANGLACCVLTYVMLIPFHLYRERVNELAGNASNENSKWTFGQIMSLATWIPVVVEIASVILCEYLPVLSASLIEYQLTQPKTDRKRA